MRDRHRMLRTRRKGLAQAGGLSLGEVLVCITIAVILVLLMITVFASGRGLSKTVDLLICSGARVTAIDGSCSTPLHHAVRHGHAEVTTCLLEAGADAHAKDRAYMTPLDYAREANSHALVELLLSRSRIPDAERGREHEMPGETE